MCGQTDVPSNKLPSEIKDPITGKTKIQDQSEVYTCNLLAVAIHVCVYLP